ncbi:hypothetical protein HPB47_001975 [Ixodes persulcatus]|uniref:Uncharacterized protein n=1 Tax=Ixodes persulcatus TaxID=34615 RepID=A0AC60PML3_IXOPE|nr:hypothetical protein HPB47_001975 [Ixodes persulcatus]
MGALHFQVVVNSKAAVRKLLDAGGLSIGGNLVPLVPVGPQVTAVTVLFLLAHVPDELLVRSLAQHGKVQEITHGVYKDTPSIKTGTRYAKMEMKEQNPVPNFLRIGGYRVTCDYRGMKRVCRRCKKRGPLQGAVHGGVLYAMCVLRSRHRDVRSGLSVVRRGACYS